MREIRDSVSTIWHSILPAKQTIISKNDQRNMNIRMNTHRHTGHKYMNNNLQKGNQITNKSEMKDDGNLTSAIHSKHFSTFSPCCRSFSYSVQAKSGNNNDNSITKTIRTYVRYMLMNMCFRKIVLYQMKPIRMIRPIWMSVHSSYRTTNQRTTLYETL